jgi:hypothetical protein
VPRPPRHQRRPPRHQRRLPRHQLRQPRHRQLHQQAQPFRLRLALHLRHSLLAHLILPPFRLHLMMMLMMMMMMLMMMVVMMMLLILKLLVRQLHRDQNDNLSRQIVVLSLSFHGIR